MNRIEQRYIAHGTWRAASALHTGGEDDSLVSAADMMLLRDSAGRFLISGASVAGAARSYIARVRMPNEVYGNEIPAEPPEIRALFGGGDPVCNDDFASLLTVRDAWLNTQAQPVVRDGVRIEGEYGVAAEGAKYNIQALPAGCEFQLRFELGILETLPHDLHPDDVLDVFYSVLGGFASGAIALGAKTRRGFGAGRVEDWIVWRLDMSNRDHLVAWLRRDMSAVQPLADAPIPTGLPTLPQGNSYFEVTAQFRVKTSLLVRAAADPAMGGKAPDSVHLTEGGKQVLPGTSVAGALRQRCLRIANTLGAPELVDPLFGSVDERDPEQNRASRVRFAEAEVGPGEIQVQGRVSIDRFTGAAKDSALFDEAAFWPNEEAESHVAFRMSVDNPTHSEVGLLALAFKDLWLGDLPVGGGAAAGRGVLTGWSADVLWKRAGHDDARVKWKTEGHLANQISVLEGDLSFLNDAVAQLNGRYA